MDTLQTYNQMRDNLQSAQRAYARGDYSEAGRYVGRASAQPQHISDLTREAHEDATQLRNESTQPGAGFHATEDLRNKAERSDDSASHVEQVRVRAINEWTQARDDLADRIEQVGPDERESYRVGYDRGIAEADAWRHQQYAEPTLGAKGPYARLSNIPGFWAAGGLAALVLAIGGALYGFWPDGGDSNSIEGESPGVSEGCPDGGRTDVTEYDACACAAAGGAIGRFVLNVSDQPDHPGYYTCRANGRIIFNHEGP